MEQRPTPQIAAGFGVTPGGQSRSVYIIDDDVDVRKSLHFLLSACALTAWPFGEAADFLDQVQHLVPGPILLDLRMPGIDGLQMLATLKECGSTGRSS